MVNKDFHFKLCYKCRHNRHEKSDDRKPPHTLPLFPRFTSAVSSQAIIQIITPSLDPIDFNNRASRHESVTECVTQQQQLLCKNGKKCDKTMFNIVCVSVLACCKCRIMS